MCNQKTWKHKNIPHNFDSGSTGELFSGVVMEVTIFKWFKNWDIEFIE